MKLQLLILLMTLAVLAWWLFGTRLAPAKARLARAFRVAALAYLGIVAVRLATSPVDQEQMQVGAISLLFFATLWALAWAVTRVLQR